MADAPTREEAVKAWEPVADQLHWQRRWDELFHEEPPFHRWFVGGEFNLAENCTDRHLPHRGDQVAIWWEGEPGDHRSLTYAQLHDEVLRLAAGLRDLGVVPGDRIALHLGWLPETVVAFLAALRLGAEVTVIPVALPVEALSARLADYRPRVLFTQDGGWRRGAILPLKARADEAIEAISGVERTIVLRRTGVQVEWFEGDTWYDEVLAPAGADVPAPGLPAEHHVITSYLANRGGHPVAIRAGAANLAVVALANHVYAMGEGEVFWGATDVSWLGGQIHGILGPLLSGTSAVMYEGTLDFPDPTRTWRIVERYGVTSLLTSPSVVTALRAWSLQPSHGVDSLRRIVTIGERLEPEVRAWLVTALDHPVTLVDGWGQTELGGIVAYARDVADPAMPDPGFAVVDEHGRPVPDGVVGEWAMLQPWSGVMRAVGSGAGDLVADHWDRIPGVYATGDLARRQQDKVEFLGRRDEVISISGQLVSLTEVRDVLLDQPFVVAAEAFERVDTHLGRSVGAAVVLEPGAPDDVASLRALQDSVRELLGGLSRPKVLLVLDRLGDQPAGPSLRRALAAVATAATSEPLRVAWEQVVSAGEPPPRRRDTAR